MSVVSLPRIEPGFNSLSHAEFLFPFGFSELHVKWYFTSMTLSLHRSVLHSFWASAGRAWPGILRTFWECSIVADFQEWEANLLRVRLQLFGGFWYFNLFLSSLSSYCLCPLEYGIRVRVFFVFFLIWYEYVNVCSALSLTALWPFFLLKFWRKGMLNESFSLETIVFVPIYTKHLDKRVKKCLHCMVCMLEYKHTHFNTCYQIQVFCWRCGERKDGSVCFGSQTGSEGTGPGPCDILRGQKANHKICTKKTEFFSGRQKDART